MTVTWLDQLPGASLRKLVRMGRIAPGLSDPFVMVQGAVGRRKALATPAVACRGGTMYDPTNKLRHDRHYFLIKRGAATVIRVNCPESDI